MSFSARVKEELSHQLSKARHCQIAELAAILSLCGKIHIDEVDYDDTSHISQPKLSCQFIGCS